MESINMASKDIIISQNNYLSTRSALNVSDANSADIKTRNYFFKGEQLLQEEDESIEYKNYQTLFDYKYNTCNQREQITQVLIDQLKKQFCGFLNRKGGRIYIGINDDKIVIGNNLNSKDRDKTRNELTNLTSDFYPKCRTDKIRIVYVPVKDINTDRCITNLYVIKIIIKQGEVDRLYSITSKGFRSFMRLDGQCVELSSEEIEKNLISRRSGENLFKKTDPDDFDDTQPSVPLTSDTEDPIIHNKSLCNLPIMTNTTPLLKRNINISLPPNNFEVIDLAKDHVESRQNKLHGFSAIRNSRSSRKKKFSCENFNQEYSYKDKQLKLRRPENSPTPKISHNNLSSVKIAISNLRNDTTKDHVKEMLRDFNFDSSIPIMIKRYDKYDYSCAFVHFQLKIEAIQAKQSLHGKEVNNRVITVKIM